MKVLCVNNTVEEVNISSQYSSKKIEKMAIETIFVPLLCTLVNNTKYLYNLKNKKVKELSINISFPYFSMGNIWLIITHKKSKLKRKKILLSIIFKEKICKDKRDFAVSEVVFYNACRFSLLQDLYNTLEIERLAEFAKEKERQIKIFEEKEERRIKTEIMYSYM